MGRGAEEISLFWQEGQGHPRWVHILRPLCQIGAAAHRRSNLDFDDSISRSSIRLVLREVELKGAAKPTSEATVETNSKRWPSDRELEPRFHLV